MVPRGARHELVDSVRLFVRAERWLFAGLVGGGVGYLIWVAGTGAAFEPVARTLADALSLDRGTVEVWAHAFLWVALPSLVAARYVVDRLTNLRGNVEQCYRFDQPITLLAPPAFLVFGVVAFAALQGTVGAVVLVALGGANVFVLVRTVAYGYRVYSLSAPRLLQGLLVVAALAMSLGIVWRVAPMTGREALVESMAIRYGVGGTVTLGASSVPVLEVAGAMAPGVVAFAYVWAQLFASLVVRIQGPDVSRSEIRAGQRYPQFVQPGTDHRLARGTVPEPSEASRDGDESPGEASADVQDGADTDSAARAAGTDGGPGAADEDTATTGDDDTATTGDDHQFGQTRVYTPPEDDEEAEVVVKSERCSICDETYDAKAGYTNCPNCNAVLDED